MGLLIAEILSHLFRHRARTLLTLSGLSVGILALTLLGSLGEAVNVSLDQQEAAALSMFEVRPSTWERHLTPAVRRAIRHVPGVAGTLTSLWADLIPPEEKQETGFAFTVEALMAVDSDIPGLERSLAPHDASLHRGRWPARGATNEVLLDFDLASVRGWDVGDTVGIRGRPFVVTGILERPRLGSNARYAYVDYEALRNLLHLPADNLQTLYVIPEPGQDAAALAARIEDAVAEAVRAALAGDAGSVLAFLPGEAEIRRVAERLEAGSLPAGTEICPLYGALPPEAQDRNC